MIESQIFLCACLLGVFLGFMYDFFKVYRLLLCSKNTSIFFQDILYFFVSAVLTFVFVLCFNCAEVRFYIFIGEIIGWMVYYLTIENTVFRYFSRVSLSIKNFLAKLYGEIYNLWQRASDKFGNKATKTSN